MKIKQSEFLFIRQHLGWLFLFLFLNEIFKQKKNSIVNYNYTDVDFTILIIFTIIYLTWLLSGSGRHYNIIKGVDSSSS